MNTIKWILVTIILGSMASCSEDSMDIPVDNPIEEQEPEFFEKYNDRYFKGGIETIYIHNGKWQTINNNNCELGSRLDNAIKSWEEDGDLYLEFQDGGIAILRVTTYNAEFDLYDAILIQTTFQSDELYIDDFKGVPKEWACDYGNPEPPFTI